MERGVALLVSQAVIDRLEIVEIDENERSPLSPPTGVGYMQLDLLGESPAIEEPGQTVGAGEFEERLLTRDLLDGDPNVSGLSGSNIATPTESPSGRLGSPENRVSSL